MTDTLHLDYETKCDLDIKIVGLDRYTAHPSFQVMMAAYRINNNPLEQWQAHLSRMPAELKEALSDPQVQKWGFNSQFERISTIRGLGIETPIESWRCSMVLSYMQSFTGSLAEVGEQIGLAPDKQKQKDGTRLIRMFTIPQKPSRNQPYEWRNWRTDPVDWGSFEEYNRQDVIAEEAIKNRLISYPILDDEWRFYHLDQAINDAGMPLDHQFVQNVIWMSERRKNELLDQMAEITGLRNSNSVSQLLPWLQVNGYPYDDLTKESVEKALIRHKVESGLLSEACAEVLRHRQWSSRTSTTKAIAARRTVGAGDRVRFMYQFAGAGRTNRFAGRNVQPQNLPRTPKLLDPEDGEERLNYATNLIRNGDYDGFELFLDEPMRAFTGCMRSMFRAPPGYEFKVMDYSSVETVGAGWLCQCERLLNVFRNNLDAYKDFGAALYKKPYDAITRAERQIAKPAVLGCTYRLSAGKIVDGHKTGLLAYAENMGVELSEQESIDSVRVFRETYSEIPEFWYACERAIRHVLTTHQPFTLGYVRFEWLKPYLLIRLPSGRYIYYYKPRLEERVVNTGRVKVIRSHGMAMHGAPEGTRIEVPDTYVKTVFTYMGRNQRTTQWDRIEGHGGVTLENIDQALCRDILKVGLQRLDEDGFEIVGHSHDEAICLTEIGDNYHTLDRMRELFTQPIDWAPGFPLRASGYAAPFYRK